MSQEREVKKRNYQKYDKRDAGLLRRSVEINARTFDGIAMIARAIHEQDPEIEEPFVFPRGDKSA